MHRFGTSRKHHEEDVAKAERFVAKLNGVRRRFLRTVGHKEGIRFTRTVLHSPCSGLLIENELRRELRMRERTILEAIRRAKEMTYAVGPDEMRRTLNEHRAKNR